MDTVSIFSSNKTGRFLSKNFLRFALGFSFALLVGNQAAAQYGGGMGGGGGTPSYTPPKGGYSSAKGAGIGAGAAAGAGVLFLALHHRGYLTGCVQPTEDGLRLVDEKKNQSYALVSGDVYLTPGQRVELKGKRFKNESGTQTFEPKKLVKDLGTCSTPPAVSSNNASAR